MKQLIEAIVKALVDKPEEVQIKEVIGSTPTCSSSAWRRRISAR